jgi:sugar lactone lactonase YvrE
MKPEVVVDLDLRIGENPLWYPGERCVLWENIEPGRIYRFDPETGAHEVVFEGGVIGGFSIQEDGSLLLFMENGSVRKLKDGTLSVVVRDIGEEIGTRFNDVIADPEGRVFCGTIPGNDGTARLYRLDRDGSIVKVQDGIGLSNGMGFTPDLKNMYHTDSHNRTIYIYDYERETGELRNRRIFVETPAGEGVPDGLTVDSEGCVWSARWDGGCVVRYSPGGAELFRVALPVKKVSSVTFGGEGYSDLYVTTAGGENRADEGRAAGALFRVRTGFRGVPEFTSGVAL